MAACASIPQTTRVVLNQGATNPSTNPNGFSFMSCAPSSLVASIFDMGGTAMSGTNGTVQLDETGACGVRVLSAFCGGTFPAPAGMRATPTNPAATMWTWANPTTWRSVVGHPATEFGVSAVTGDGGVSLTAQTRMCLDVFPNASRESPTGGYYAIRPMVFRVAPPAGTVDVNAFFAAQCPRSIISGTVAEPCRRTDAAGNVIDGACPP